MTRKEAERQEAIELLRSKIAPGDTVRTILRNVSRSGMSRRISLVLSDCSDITWLVGRALDYHRNDRDGGLVVSGCGMDMGYHLVSCLSRALFPDGFECIGERGNGKRGCPSNDHNNFDRNYAPHHHNSPDYALWHDWM